MISLAKNAIIKVRDNSRRKSTHDRAHDVRGTSVLRRPEQSVEVASRANTVTPDYIGREVRYYDSFRNYFDISWYIDFALYFWWLDCSVSCLSRQEEQEEIKMPHLSDPQMRRGLLTK